MGFTIYWEGKGVKVCDNDATDCLVGIGNRIGLGLFKCNLSARLWVLQVEESKNHDRQRKFTHTT